MGSMRGALLCVGMMVVLVGLGGCRTPSPRTMSRTETQATMLRGTLDNHWKAIGLALERGDNVHPTQVYRASEMRIGVISAQMRVAMQPLMPDAQDYQDAKEFLNEVEGQLPTLLAMPLSQAVQIPEPTTAGKKK